MIFFPSFSFFFFQREHVFSLCLLFHPHPMTTPHHHYILLAIGIYSAIPLFFPRHRVHFCRWPRQKRRTTKKRKQKRERKRHRKSVFFFLIQKKKYHLVVPPGKSSFLAAAAAYSPFFGRIERSERESYFSREREKERELLFFLRRERERGEREQERETEKKAEDFSR